MSNTETYSETAMAERFSAAQADSNADIGLQLANALVFLSIYSDRTRLEELGQNIADLERKAMELRLFIIAVSCHIETLDPDHVIARRWATLVQEVSA